ncbi:embryonic polarity protein dorsal [Microplitis mediator]|uniref:embryonic polarity protein dorsal n=1 Tax=Microplitis mediator TaxID=375433 RepID=UPI0025559E22|nr:embryonic polarity protein dorsal [Microplitis mediator]
MDQYHDMNDNINISDVIEVIQTTDPEFVEESRCRNQQQQQALNMMSGGGVETRPVLAGNTSARVGSYVEIVEQPASKALRFRYECEGRSAGSIPGVNSSPENKTFPSIRIVGYKGRAVVVVSCVTKDPPYRPHPHNLVGKEACRRGVCTLEISSENMTVTFANLGIQCVKKKDIEEALRVREEIRVDPFRTGFEHKRQPASIDLNAVRLCFQVFLEGTDKGKFTVPLTPIVSDPIYDKKAMSDLVICKLSHYSAPVAGGMEMILLCEKVAKEDIQIRFFEERDGQFVWEGFGDFQPSHVHKQVAIAFRTPTYRIQQVEHPVQIYVQLRRPSDNATSEALPFQFLPLGAGRPAFWSLRKILAKKKPDPEIFNKILSSDTSVFAGINQRLPRNLDEFNNNTNNNNNDSFDLAISHGKISALRALNDLYNKNTDTLKKLNNSQQLIINSPSNIIDIDIDNENDNENLKTVNNSSKKYLNDDELNKIPLQNESTITEKKIYTDNINTNNSDIELMPKDKTDWFDYSEVGKWVHKSKEESLNSKTEITNKNNDNNLHNTENILNNDEETKSLNELITQVAELDEIYADTHTKILQNNLLTQSNSTNDNKYQQTFMDIDNCDNQTYTSLQLAMKNPIDIRPYDRININGEDDRKYEDVAIPSRETSLPPGPPPPLPPSSSLLISKRDVTYAYDEKIPPLPPKRLRKMTTSMPTLPRSSSQCKQLSINDSAPHKNLPSLPPTLTKSKQSLFAKLFNKKHSNNYSNKKDGDNNREMNVVRGNILISDRNDCDPDDSSMSLRDSTQDISSKNFDLPRASVASVTAVKSFNIDGDESPPYGIELTEAEHYALYTAMAPHATASEFDELSFYYSPVEGGKILTDTKET